MGNRSFKQVKSELNSLNLNIIDEDVYEYYQLQVKEQQP
jgi:hypothetical protein